MSNISVDYDILNQKQTPAFYASSLATIPAFGYPGRIFIDTDTPSSGIYRDTGSAWVQVADPGAGTTGTLQQVTTNGNSTNLPIVVQNMLLSKGAGTGSNNTGLGINALVFNITGYSNTAIGSGSLLNNTTGIQNTAIGKSSLTSNTIGNSNTAIGTVALGSNTTANYNTAIGTSALSSNTTGSQNIGIGVSALLTNTTADGNLAIGNNSMSSNTTGANNVAVGNSSLNANTTGNSNVAVGIASLQVNTTGGSNNGLGISSLSSNTTGNANNAFGTSSLFYNTTGSQNTAIGNSALQNNISGDSNTAIGNTALNSNTTASQNTAIGNAALSTNTTGTSNTAIGAVALQFSTTSSNNTAIGNGALNKNTTGNNNTAIGYLALQNNTTGIENTAVGLSSLGVNTTGQYNVAFGRSSLNANTVGNFNTAIGSQALANVTTGSQNIVIGYNSGGGITTGNANTIIGTSVTGLSATLSNNIILADGAGNVRLFSDANGLIAINQAVGSTPGGQLDIHTAQTYALVLNGLTTNNAYTAFSNNSVGKWRIGNTYNAGANTFDIYNINTSSNALSFNNTTNAAVFNSSITATSLIKSGGTSSQYLMADGSVSTLTNPVTGTGTSNYVPKFTGSTTIGNSAITDDGTTVTLVSRALSGTSATFSGTNLTLNNTSATGSDPLITIQSLGGGNPRLKFLGQAGVINRGSAADSLFFGETGDSGSYSFRGSGGLEVGYSAIQGAYKLDVNGTGRFTGALTGGGNITTSLSQASSTDLSVSNTSASNGAMAQISAINGGASQIDMVAFGSGSTGTLYGITKANLKVIRDNSLTAQSNGLAIGADAAVPLYMFTNSVERMRITSGGNVLIGSTTDDTINKLQVTGSGIISSDLTIGAAAAATNRQLIFNGVVNKASRIKFQESGVDKWLIGNGAANETGNFEIFNASGTIVYQVNKTTNATTFAGTATFVNLAGTGSRAVLADANGLLSAPVSDISVKENIKSIGYGLNEVLKMNPVWFNYNDEYKNFGKGRQNGNIAQEMEAIIPEAVFTTPTTGKMGINYDQLHAIYIKAIQELKAEIDALKKN